MRWAEREIARSSRRDYINEVRVDRHGIGRGDLRLQSVVAGGGFVRSHWASLRATA